MLTLRNALFFVLVPGMVGVAGPWWVARGTGTPQARAPWLAVAAVVAAAGLALLLSCVAWFQRHGGTPAPIDPPRRLVVRGPYRWTRNPMYVALALLLVAQILAHPGRAVLLYALAALAGVVAFVHLYEEPTLRRRFGADYEAYTASVPRWFPRIRL